jgi:hypothetical protein
MSAAPFFLSARIVDVGRHNLPASKPHCWTYAANPMYNEGTCEKIQG